MNRFASGCVLVVGLACGLSCGSSASPPSADPDAANDGGSNDAVDQTPERPPSDAAAPVDGDAAAAPKVCLPDGGWDVSLPADSGCTSRSEDTDRDGVPDCADLCPYDRLKIAPGFCGCNRPDTDSDGDGMPDCNDTCPNDPNDVTLGDCGCVGPAGVEPAGQACYEPACPQQNPTCNGAGVCGDRAACLPCPGGHYIVDYESAARLWFCGSLPRAVTPSCALEDGGGGPGVSWMVAQSMCAAKGLTLARLEDGDLNGSVTKLITGLTWIGANALQTPGQWYWSSATTNSDDPFWSGGVDGMRVNGRLANWAPGAPAAATCAALNPVSGLWVDTDCNQQLGFICEYVR